MGLDKDLVGGMGSARWQRNGFVELRALDNSRPNPGRGGGSKRGENGHRGVTIADAIGTGFVTFQGGSAVLSAAPGESRVGVIIYASI